jgi:hypothetical protein
MSNNILFRLQNSKTVGNLCRECYYILPRNVELWRLKRLESKKSYKNTVPYNSYRGWFWKQQGEGENWELWYAVLKRQRKHSKFWKHADSLVTSQWYQPMPLCHGDWKDHWHLECDVCSLVKCTDVSGGPAAPIMSEDEYRDILLNWQKFNDVS